MNLADACVCVCVCGANFNRFVKESTMYNYSALPGAQYLINN